MSGFNISSEQQRFQYSRQVSRERHDFDQPSRRTQLNVLHGGQNFYPVGSAPLQWRIRRFENFSTAGGGAGAPLSSSRPTSRVPAAPFPAGAAPSSAAVGRNFPSFRSNRSTAATTSDFDPIVLDAYKANRLEQLKRLLTIKGVYTEVNRCKTVADLAAEDGKFEVLDLLKELSVDFNRRNAEGMVPLHYALKKRHYRTIRYLHSLGASPDIPLPSSISGRGLSDYPLHVACASADKKMLDTLLDYCGAELHVLDAQGNTPLHRACLEDSLVAVKRLAPHLSSEVLNVRGHEGKTALHIAVLNQNRQIVDLLLSKGTLVDVPADSGKTVIDLILQLNNPMLLNDFARFYSIRMTEGVTARNLMALSHEKHFEKYLEFLSHVDNEFNECTMEIKDISEVEKETLCAKLQHDDRIDLMEFKEVIVQLLQTEDIHYLIMEDDRDVLVKIVENIVHYVLFREDAVMLERIMYCGVLWSKVSLLIEDHLDSLYIQAPEREVNGIVMHFKSRFVEQNRVRHDKLSKYYGSELSCYNLQPYYLGFNPNIQYMRHPMTTLPVWSVLSGRLSLTELLLRQEKFDVVPLSLFCAALLRTFPMNQELVVEEEEIEALALTCEKFARKVVEKVNSIDTSYNRSVSVDYLLRPLESYGGISCVKLAASNECSRFLQSELCQRALDKMWFRSLLHMNPILREIIIWMGAIPLNFLVPLVLLYYDEKEMRTRRRHEERSFVQEDETTPIYEKFHLLPKLPLPADQSADSLEDQITRRRGSNAHSLGTQAGQKLAKEAKQQAHSSSSLHKENQQKKEAPIEEIEFRQMARPNSKVSEKSDASSLLHKADEQDEHSILSSIGTRALRRFRRFFQLISEFYDTPAVKFRYHVASHVLLVALLSYLLLMDFQYELSIKEIIVYAILSGMLLEEVGEIAQYTEHDDIKSYFRSKWNIIDITALTCGVVGFSIRISEIKYSQEWSDMMRDFEDKAWYTARISLSICCTLYWIRLLYISTVLENLGPKLKMIAKMITKDLLPFLLILFIFILGFGVLMHSLLYPNGYRAWNYGQLNKVHVLLGMLKICFYSMVGEYSLDTIMGDDSCEMIYETRENNTSSCPHHFGRYLVPYLILPLYVIVTEILLLNLIVAMFSKTIETIDSRSKGLWQFERHDLIEEFETRSSLPPPLNVFDLVRKFFLLLKSYCRRVCHKNCRCRTRHAGGGGGGGSFRQKLVTQFLLFQAFGLRKCREEMMRQCLPKQETETDAMLDKVRDIVEAEVNRLISVTGMSSAEGDGSEGAQSIAADTLLEATPPPPPPQSQSSSRPPLFPTGTKSLDCLADDGGVGGAPGGAGSGVGGAPGGAGSGVGGRPRVRLRELIK
ncbi:hypothetical protein BOX15_Mlig019746g1 [Macrostomum lignano]|uniref:Uncharacterized protein n=1 Tax=Macrostomum lignano TaxID=282301 RepID=A0A267ETH8_9PLAT|nr:hypothetical protein BOX15_Mlig019746g1 [Macrostomum lignano]